MLKSSYTSLELKKSVNKLDYLIIACPLTKKTKGIINKSILKPMKKNSVIINVARGGVINEKDLYFALKNKDIGGAIIDTWFNYPTNKKQNRFNPSSFNYYKMPNVTMTPHISAWSEGMIKRRSIIISENINRLYKSRKLLNEIKY